MDDQRIEFRSTTSRVIAGVILLGALGGLAAAVASDGVVGGLRVLPPLAFLAVFAWAAYWRPAIVVDTEAVSLIGVIATVRIPWARVETLDTRWALTITSGGRKHTAWGAPAPSRHALYRVTRSENQHLSDDAYLGGTIRPGDALSSDSGQAAEIVRRAWQRWRDEVSDGRRPAADDSPSSTRWHTATIAVGLVLATLTVISLLL